MAGRAGFDLPSVLVLAGSRGAAAGALRLDYHVDDSAQNCLDVIADSSARPILIVPDNDGPRSRAPVNSESAPPVRSAIASTSSRRRRWRGGNRVCCSGLASFVGWR